MEIGTQTLEMLSGVRKYTAWQYRNFEKYLGERILEVGCGIGTISGFLASRELLVAVDISEDHVNAARGLFKGKDNVTVRLGDISDDRVIELGSYGFDTAVCINVLEHIEDDARALKNMRGLLSKGGRVILLVPGVKLLYGSLDRNLGHFRRYSAAELKKKMGAAGFRVEKMFYFNFLGALGWFVTSRLLGRRMIPRDQAFFVEAAVPVISFIEEKLKPLFGLSIIAVGRRS